MKRTFAGLSIALAALFGAGCDPEPDSAEEVVEEAADDVGDALEEAGEAVEEAVE